MAEHEFGHFLLLLGEGLEPSRPKAPEPKSGVSANFTTRAEKSIKICMWSLRTMMSILLTN